MNLRPEEISSVIKEQIKNKIVSNELKTGDLLPSIRNLAKDLRISVITTKNAYEENNNVYRLTDVADPLFSAESLCDRRRPNRDTDG